MTWWSELSATPGLDLARWAIRCRFVDRFAGLRVPSRVSRQRFSALSAARSMRLQGLPDRRPRWRHLLLLGLKGTMSEYELSLMRQRGLAARDARPVAVNCA